MLQEIQRLFKGFKVIYDTYGKTMEICMEIPMQVPMHIPMNLPMEISMEIQGYPSQLANFVKTLFHNGLT